MNMNTRTAAILYSVAFAAACILFAMLALFPDTAQAANGDYMDINGASLLRDDGSGSSPIFKSGMSVLKSIVTFILLPVAILILGSKCLYLAIFGMIMGKDPLGWVDTKGKSSRNIYGDRDQSANNFYKTKSSSSNNGFTQHDVREQLLGELKMFGKSLFVVGMLWIFFQLIMLAVSVTLGIAPSLL